MAQIPILSGVYTTTDGAIHTSYPRNMVPTIQSSGIEDSYLRPSEGIDFACDLPGLCRGTIVWRDILYAVCGSKLCSITANNTVTVIGDVGIGSRCRLDFSFDYLAIVSGTNAYLYNPGSGLQQITDPNLGPVRDVSWNAGYFVFISNDGQYLIVNELSNPFEVNPLKYGSSEADPDPIQSVYKTRNETVAVNRNTIEYFQNVGGDLFPFQRIASAVTMVGAVGTHMSCSLFGDRIAVVGGGRNQAIGVYICNNGSYQKVSNSAIDSALNQYPESTLAGCLMETRKYGDKQLICIHLPNQTLVFDETASSVFGSFVWYSLDSGTTTPVKYRANHYAFFANKWYVADTKTYKLGTLTDKHSLQYGEVITWDFSTLMVFNKTNKYKVKALELVSLTGRNTVIRSSISNQYSDDGLLWSQPKYLNSGGTGEYHKRLKWFKQGLARFYRIESFSGDSNSHISVISLEAELEGLAH